MLNILFERDDVVALVYSGEITATDVDKSYDLLTAKLAKGEKLNAYFELCDDFDLEAEAVFRDLARAKEMWGHIKQFSRVALVVDEGWIKAIARIEQFFLSFRDIELHVYGKSEREHALSWVKGEVRDSHQPSLSKIETGDPNILAFEVIGKMCKQDAELGHELMRPFESENPPRCVLAKLNDYRGFELGLLGDTKMMRMKRKVMQNLERYALVGAPDWMENMADNIGVLFGFEIRTFDTDDYEEALDWLKEPVPA